MMLYSRFPSSVLTVLGEAVALAGLWFDRAKGMAILGVVLNTLFIVHLILGTLGYWLVL